MNKIKFLSGLVILLLIVNIGLCVVMYKHLHHRRPEGPRNEIIEKLHFDSQQIKQYDILIAKHRSDIRIAQEAVRVLKKSLYAELKSNSTNQNSDSLIMQINRLQNNIEYIHLHHFEDIQKLCRAEQQPYFDELTSHIAALFSPNHPPTK